MAQFPSKEIARLSYEYRTLGLGFANIGGLLMTSGIPYDSPEARAICGAITAIMTGESYATSAEMAGELGAFPSYERNREFDAARHPQPRPRRARRGARLRVAAQPPRPARPRLRARQEPRRPRRRRLGAGAVARREPRFSQRPGDGDRADRHDRPRHGLRHDRHRAGFRAGEIQETRRRRLLQDHQPRRAGSAADARLRRGADRRDDRLCGRPRHAEGRTRHQPRHAEGQGLRRGDAREDRSRPRLGLRHQIRLQQILARRSFLPQRAETFRPIRSPIRSSICSRRSASPDERSTRRTSSSAGR